MPQGRGPGRPHLLRTLNDRLALELLLEGGPLTRQQLSDRTGLSRPTASLVLTRLEAAGLVTTDGVRVASGRGPQASVYRVPTDAVLAAAVDVGRETLRAEVLDVTGTVVASATTPRTAAGTTAADGTARTAPPAWRALRDVLAAACAQGGVATERLTHVVVGVGGAYDARADRLVNSAHLPGWTGPGLVRGLERRLGMRVVVENDANLALHAARAAVAAAGADELAADDALALLWFGDGVGLAVEAGGRLHRGHTGRAGEIGYVTAPAPYGDGHRDLQALLGAGGLEGLAAGYGLPAGDPPAGDTEPAAAERVAALLRAAVELARSEARGAAARAFLGEVADLLAAALEPVLAVLDPATVLLGGPAGPAGGGLLADLVAARLGERGRWFGRVAPASATDTVLDGCRALSVRLAREALLDRVVTGSEQVAT